MSIDDDRTPIAGGSTDSGYFTPSEQRYTAYDSDDTTDFDDDDSVVTRAPHQWHFGADLGLLVLRVALGAMLVGHGLQKVFGIMQGPGIDGFAKFLGTLGYQQTTLLAWVTGVTELTAGSLLVLGLFTPAAAAAALGVMANAIWVKLDINEFLGSVELEALYAAGAFALLFAGAGKISLDRNTPWFRRAPAFGFVFLVLAIGLSVATLIVLR
ncbi:DoxX family protein [Actinokineospora sp.]|uniref:DoxX family protein n=1 Tax=Actinokineospora sp. TaxID=1872133 RepID=UPI003D6B5E88